MAYLGSSTSFYKVGWSPLCFPLCTAFLKPVQTSHSGLSSPLLNFPVQTAFISFHENYNHLPCGNNLPTSHCSFIFCASECRWLTQTTFSYPFSSLSWLHWFLDQYPWRDAISLWAVISLQFIAYGYVLFLPGCHFLKRQLDISFIHYFGPLSQVLSILYWPQSPTVVLRGSCPSCVSRKQIFFSTQNQHKKESFFL